MPKVFITDHIPNPDVEKEILGDNLSARPHENIEILLARREPITKEYMDQFPRLKAIVRYGVGYDTIDLEYTKRKGIVVCNTPDYGTDEVSDTAIAMIINIARGVSRYDYRARTYVTTWQDNAIKTIKRNSEIKLGVIGAGRIGGSVILKANALKFDTYFYDPYVSRGHEKMLNTKRVDSLDELLSLADIVSINCPLNQETRGLIDENFIAKMKQGSALVNTARGKIIKDLDLLYDALESDQLSNVALDVLPSEPPKESRLLDAWRAREEWLDGRLIINPHTAFFSDRAFFEMRQKVALNALRVLNGQEPFNIVNR